MGEERCNTASVYRHRRIDKSVGVPIKPDHLLDDCVSFFLLWKPRFLGEGELKKKSGIGGTGAKRKMKVEEGGS